MTIESKSAAQGKQFDDSALSSNTTQSNELCMSNDNLFQLGHTVDDQIILPEYLKESARLLSIGAKLVELHSFQKRPKGDDWNSNFITSIDPSATGYGLPLAANGLCSIDPDHDRRARTGCKALGIELNEVMEAGVRTQSTRPNSGGRSAFKVVDGLKWLKFSHKLYGTALELRAESSNLQDCVAGVQYATKDIGGEIYTQEYCNGKRIEVNMPEVPLKLLQLWKEWSSCPKAFNTAKEKFWRAVAKDEGWDYDAADVSKATSARDETGKVSLLYTVKGITGEYNHYHNVSDILLARDYQWHGHLGRFSAPNATGAPGIFPVTGKTDLWISNHASDLLDGMFDAWTANVVLNFGGDKLAAVQAWEAERQQLIASDFKNEELADKPRKPVYPDLVFNSSGEARPQPTFDNLAALIDWAGIDVRYDVYPRRLIAWMDGKEIDNHIDELVIDLCIRNGLPKTVVSEQLDRLAHSRTINKPLQWLESLTAPIGDPLAAWLLDNSLIDTSCEFDEQWTYIAFKRFLIGACAAADQLEQCPIEGAIPKFEEVLVLVGGQGLHKTKALMMLLPPEVRNYFSAGMNLHTDNKDSILKATGNWIVEFGELDATFRKSDVAALKAFLSNSVDEIRTPYARRSYPFPRRTVYIASVNEERFLSDTTGNRRFLPIVIKHKLKANTKQGCAIFAQAWQWYLNGEQWWLTDQEDALAELTRKPHDGNKFTELLIDAFNFDSDERSTYLKCGQILELLGFRGADMARHTTQINAALVSLNIYKKDKTSRGQRLYALPPISPEYREKFYEVVGPFGDSSGEHE